jgi:nitrogen fixation protein FixH
MRKLLIIIVVGLMALLLVGCGSSPISQQALGEQYQVRLTLDAATRGNRNIQIELRDQAGQPVSADSVIIAPSMVGMSHAQSELVATLAAPGLYRASGELFSMTGTWELAVAVRQGPINETVTFTINVSAS